MVQCELLSNRPPKRKTYDVDLLQAERTAERDGVVSHFVDNAGCFTSRGTDASVVKENHIVLFSEGIYDNRVPAIHVGIEVLKKEEWNCAGLAKTTEREANAICFNVLRGNRFVRVLVHICAPSSDAECST